MKFEIKDLESLPAISGQRRTFEQIVLNLTENAIEAADGRKWHRLVISAKQMNDHIELSFSDNCCGISKDNLQKIFEPFYSTKVQRGSKCLGLGLPIISRIVTSMGGKIRVESTVGKGTTFHVNWPLS
jgi:signal transduction histidine kinase